VLNISLATKVGEFMVGNCSGIRKSFGGRRNAIPERSLLLWTIAAVSHPTYGILWYRSDTLNQGQQPEEFNEKKIATFGDSGDVCNCLRVIRCVCPEFEFDEGAG